VNGLTLNLGNVAAGGTAWGYWILNADLDGQFTAFNASYTEQAFQGVQLSPLIVGVHTYIIVEGDAIPSGGQALQVVASDLNVPPSLLVNLETGGISPTTTDYLTPTVGTACPTTATYTLAATGGHAIAVVSDPSPSLAIASVHATYPDGTSTELYTGNGLVWRSTDGQGAKVNVLRTPR